MKKLLTLFVATFLFSIAFAVVPGVGGDPVTKTVKATEVMVPIENNMEISLYDLSIIKVKDYQKVTGKHLNLFQKMQFKAAQKKLRENIAADGTITNKHLAAAFDRVDHSTGFHIGGFALGLFIGLIGVLLAYIIKEGGEAVSKNRQKWAWIGFGVWIVILIIASA